MDRRNFIGTLLAVGAGFMVLPPIQGGRIWKAERKVILPITDGIHIWKNYYMSECLDRIPPPEPPTSGAIKPNDSALWYGTATRWLQLRKLSRPITWEIGTVYAPSRNGQWV